jgi:6-phosphogluconolactonase
MIEVEWWDYEDPAELAEAVAGDIGFIIESALDARGEALIALSGGSTPVPAFEKLAQTKLAWKHVTIVPADDRLVKVDSPLSNVGMLARIFLPKGARVMPLGADNADYRMAGRAADARLHDLKWPPDLVQLGVGADGHTASIFPSADLDEAIGAPNARRAIGLMPEPLPPEAPVARVTLTRSAILSARAIMFVIAGKDKRQVLEQAIEEGEDSPYPVGRVLAYAEQPIDIHWSST